MRILLVKTSSLGDVIHNLPAASDIAEALPEARIDWCVEEAFAELPALHRNVSHVIVVAARRWRRSLLSPRTLTELRAFRGALQATHYDAIIDTQGLLKSALMSRLANGRRLGYAAESAREPIAARFYHGHFAVDRRVHAVQRNRLLAAKALGYRPDLATIDYGLRLRPWTADWLPPRPFVVCLTATSRADKLWPESHWADLIDQLHSRGLAAVLPSGSDRDDERARAIIASTRAAPDAILAPRLGLEALAGLLRRAQSTVGVDTGLSHLSAAVGTPTIALFTASDPALTGVAGTAFCRNLGGPRLQPPVIEVLASLDQIPRA